MRLSEIIKQALANYGRLWQQATASLLVGVIVAIAGVWFVEISADALANDLPETALRLLWLSFLAFPFTFVVHLLARRFTLPQWQEWLGQAIVLGLSALYVWMIIINLDYVPLKHFIESGLWFFAGCLLIALVPFLSRKSEDNDESFWKHTLNTVDGFFLAGIFGVLFYISTAAALGALDVLFFENFHDELYGDAWFVIVGLVCVPVFANWVIDARKEVQQTLHWLRDLLVKFIFVPVSVGYMIILYAYIAKLLLTRTWPDGGVGWWIIAFTIVTIGTYLYLLNRTKQPWVQGLLAGLAVSTLPQLVVLIWAMWVRVQEYGLTEWRYLAFVYAAWVAGIVIYSVFSKVKDRRWIFLSLAVILVLVSIGPWRASSIAKTQQLNRFETLLIDNSVWSTENGNNLEQAKKVDNQTSASIFSILTYLVDYHGTDPVEPYLAKPIDEIRSNMLGGQRDIWPTDIFRDGLGFTDDQAYYSNYDGVNNSDYVNFNKQEKGGLLAVPTMDYDYVLSLTYFSRYTGSDYNEFTLGEFTYSFKMDFNKKTFTVTNTTTKEDIISRDASDWLNQLATVATMPEFNAIPAFEAEGGGLAIRLIPISLNRYQENTIEDLQIQPLVEQR